MKPTQASLAVLAAMPDDMLRAELARREAEKRAKACGLAQPPVKRKRAKRRRVRELAEEPYYGYSAHGLQMG